MARLQDFQSVTPASSDNLLIVQATGQGLVNYGSTIGNKAPKSDLASISIIGNTNNTGSTIKAGTFFYLNGSLVRAKTDISNGATLTSESNYEEVTDGGLNKMKSVLDNVFGIYSYTLPSNGSITHRAYHKMGKIQYAYPISANNTGAADSIFVNHGASNLRNWWGVNNKIDDTNYFSSAISFTSNSNNKTFTLASTWPYDIRITIVEYGEAF